MDGVGAAPGADGAFRGDAPDRGTAGPAGVGATGEDVARGELSGSGTAFAVAETGVAGAAGGAGTTGAGAAVAEAAGLATSRLDSGAEIGWAAAPAGGVASRTGSSGSGEVTAAVATVATPRAVGVAPRAAEATAGFVPI